MARSFCCQAPLETYHSQGKPIYWVCRLCERECLADGKESPGWRELGNNPYHDIDRAFSMIRAVQSFDSGLDARRVTTKYLIMAQRQAFTMGAMWRDHNTHVSGDECCKVCTTQAERMFPIPVFDLDKDT